MMRIHTLWSLLFSILADLTDASIGATVSFQLHSYDDLREWPQVLRKGGRSIKIDPQYQSAAFCASQPNANRSDERGCLLLNHDSVVTSNWYFVLDDVLDFLTDPNNRDFFNRSDTFYIALCFKGSGGLFGPCDGTSGANDWLSLVDDFYTAANAVVSDNNLNVQFVLDGDGDPAGGSCVLQRWRPWVATYISGSDPAEAFYSNDATLAFDRYQVLNEDTSHWEYAVNNSYGKFVNSTHSYQCWEPSDQPTTLNLTSFRFAVNTDVAQFETYVGSVTGRAWNHYIPGASEGRSPKVTIIQVDGSIYGNALLGLIAYMNGTTAVLASTTFPGPYSAPSKVSTTILPRNGIPLALNAWTLKNGSVVVVALQATLNGYDTMSTSFLVANDGTIVSREYVGATLPWPVDAAALARCRPSEELDLDSVCVTVVSLPNSTAGDCIVSATSVTANGTQIIPAACLASTTALRPNQAAVSTAISGEILLAAATYAANGSIYGALFCSDSSSGSFFVNNPTACGLPGSTATATAALTPLRTHVGDQPAVALAVHPVSNLPIVLETHGTGYCPNNEPQNKDAYIKLCDQQPVSDGGAYLNYNFGYLSDWIAQLQAGNLSSPCSPSLYHGMFDMGDHPAPSLFNFDNTLDLAVVVEGISASTTDPNNCGIAVAGDGLKLDGWMPFPLSS